MKTIFVLLLVTSLLNLVKAITASNYDVSTNPVSNTTKNTTTETRDSPASIINELAHKIDDNLYPDRIKAAPRITSPKDSNTNKKPVIKIKATGPPIPGFLYPPSVDELSPKEVNNYGNVYSTGFNRPYSGGYPDSNSGLSGNGNMFTQGYSSSYPSGGFGMMGLQGINDFSSMNGMQGINDYSSLNGYQGMNGMQGANGMQGFNNNWQGMNGMQGFNNNFQGMNGLQNMNGMMQGANSFLGANGMQGFGGMQGADNMAYPNSNFGFGTLDNNGLQSSRILPMMGNGDFASQLNLLRQSNNPITTTPTPDTTTSSQDVTLNSQSMDYPDYMDGYNKYINNQFPNNYNPLAFTNVNSNQAMFNGMNTNAGSNIYNGMNTNMNPMNNAMYNNVMGLNTNAVNGMYNNMGNYMNMNNMNNYMNNGMNTNMANAMNLYMLNGLNGNGMSNYNAMNNYNGMNNYMSNGLGTLTNTLGGNGLSMMTPQQFPAGMGLTNMNSINNAMTGSNMAGMYPGNPSNQMASMSMNNQMMNNIYPMNSITTNPYLAQQMGGMGAMNINQIPNMSPLAVNKLSQLTGSQSIPTQPGKYKIGNNGLLEINNNPGNGGYSISFETSSHSKPKNKNN